MTDDIASPGKRWRQRLGRVGLIAGVSALILGAVLVVNSNRLHTRQLPVPNRTQAMVDLNAETLAETLAEFLAVPSYSYDDRSHMDASSFYKLHEILERRFPEVHRVLHREQINNLTLLYRWDGSDDTLEPMLLMSHLDVVPVEEGSRSEWVHPHDDGTVADGFVWGRGALDVKCGVIGIMAAVEYLLADGFAPERTIYLAFGHDEEVGGVEGNALIAQRLADQGVRLSFILDEGGAILDGVIPGAPRPVAFIAVAEKVSARLTLTAHGEGGHGSMPGRSAILNLAEAIIRVDENPMPVRITDATATLFDFLGPEMPFLQRVVMGNRWLFDGVIARRFARSPSTNAVVRSTLNVTQIGTGTSFGQSATTATATINTRLLPGDTSEDVRAHLLKLTEDLLLCTGEPAIECEVEQQSPGELVSPIDCEQFLTLQRTIHEVFPDVIVGAGLTSVSTDSRWYYGVTDKVYRFIPMRLKQDDVTRIHGINERISVRNLAELAVFYGRLIQNAGLDTDGTHSSGIVKKHRSDLGAVPNDPTATTDVLEGPSAE